MCQPRDESLSAGMEKETTERGCARRIDSDRKLNPRGKRDSSIINILPRQGKAMGSRELRESTGNRLHLA
jgi:hypothetical protein